MTTESSKDTSGEPGNSASQSSTSGMETGESAFSLESTLLKVPGSSTRQEVEAMIRAWRTVRGERLTLQRRVTKLEDQEKILKAWVIEAFRQQKLEGMLIEGRLTGLTTGKALTVEDKEALVKYIYDSKALSILQFRLAEAAINERRDAGEDVPGVGEVEIYGLYDRQP